MTDKPKPAPEPPVRPNSDPMAGAARVPEENTYAPMKGGLR